jgi:hypothetical protein
MVWPPHIGFLSGLDSRVRAWPTATSRSSQREGHPVLRRRGLNGLCRPGSPGRPSSAIHTSISSVISNGQCH